MASRPNCIDPWETMEWLESIDPRIAPFYVELSRQGWEFYVVKQSRGRCQMAYKTCTVPLWVLSAPKDKQTWYLAHEMAHAYDACRHKHGPEFMEWLKKICPTDCLHYELGYKPRNASAAGIRRPTDDIDPFDLL
jgi:hypothetical protein